MNVEQKAEVGNFAEFSLKNVHETESRRVLYQTTYIGKRDCYIDIGDIFSSYPYIKNNNLS